MVLGLIKEMVKIQPKQPEKRKVMKGTEKYRCEQMSYSLSGRGQWQKASLSYNHEPTVEHATLPRQSTLYHHHIKRLKKKEKKAIKNTLKYKFFQQGSLMVPTDVENK